MSHQALEERVVRSVAWLRHLLGIVLAQSTAAPLRLPAPVRRLVIRDVTIIARPNSPGTEWRVHLSWELFALRPVGLALTDTHTGEGFSPQDIQAGDLMVGDRAYGLWRHLHVVGEALAFFIFRVTWSNLPLRTCSGQAFDLIAWLKALPRSASQAETTVYAAQDPQQRPLRLVVGRLPPDKAAAAQAAVRKHAQKEGRAANPHTLFAATFCILVTNLPASTWPHALILAMYRLRWQIEWCFRRCKSLCLLTALPSYPAPIAEPLLLAKLLLIVLVQRLISDLPWSQWWTTDAPPPLLSVMVQIAYAHLRDILCPAEALRDVLVHPTRYLRYLRPSRRKRLAQLVAGWQLLAQLSTS